MRSVSIRQLDMKQATIPLGFEGENEFTEVRIDCKKTFDQHPNAVPSMTVTDPAGNKYPAVVTRDGDIVVWNITAGDLTTKGYGEIQIEFIIDGTVIGKTDIARTRIERSIFPEGEAPEPVQNWIDEANQTLSEVEEAKQAFPAGGTTGQVLTKKSGEDYDTEWQTPQGGGGGTSNYNDLDNKPSINGVTLSGNKSLSDLSIPSQEDVNAKYTKPQGGIPASDIDPSAIPSPTSIIDDNAGEGDTTKVLSADKVTEIATGLREAIENVTEDYGTQYEWIPVTIASPLPVKENYRCADSRGAKVGKTYDQATEGYTSSSVTSCVMSAFTCESGKKYRLTVTNGQTPAKTAERGTIVIAKDYNSLKNVVLEAFRTTNTSNATDVFEFTPTEPGYVYFNLDANFQSIAVEVESVVGSSKTAVDDVVRNHVLNREITPELEFESGTFDTTLADASGSGYRSQIITGVKDCAICIKVDPDYTAMFGNGTDALVTVHGSYVYHSTKDAVRLWASDTVANSGLEIRIYKEKGHRGEFDVIVAASDSSDVDKQIADIVCDGTNDEIDLQFAVNWNFYRQIGNSSRDSVNVLLLPGNYYIDNFETKETLHGDDTVAQYAVMVGNDSFSGNAGYYYSASISGVSKTGHITNGAVTKINVTNGAVATLSDNVENVLIGVCRAGSRAGGGIHMNSLCIEVKNLSIYTNGGSNKIVALDGYTAGTSIFENNDVWSVASTSSWTPTSISEIPSGSIGIRAGDGSCYGVRQSIKGNRISGYHEGVAIVGEHFIIQDNLELRCTYGFTVNQYEHNGANQHPNVFIGNSVEQCYTMGRLGSYTSKQTLVYIGGSVENMIGNTGGEDVAMLPIEVSYDTKYRGRIESDSLVSPYDESMFESGKGTGFEQVIYPYTQA